MLVFLSHFYSPNIITSLVFHTFVSHSSLCLHPWVICGLPLSICLTYLLRQFLPFFPWWGVLSFLLDFLGEFRSQRVFFILTFPRSCALILGAGTWETVTRLEQSKQWLRRRVHSRMLYGGRERTDRAPVQELSLWFGRSYVHNDPGPSPLLSIINRSRNLIMAAAAEGFSGNHAQERPRSPKLKWRGSWQRGTPKHRPVLLPHNQI